MSTSKSSSNRKRQHEDESHSTAPQHKRQQFIAKNDQPLNIMDIANHHCLDIVCEYLDLKSLFNVAASNQLLSHIARDVYKRKFGVKQVWLISSGYSMISINLTGDKIRVSGLKMVLQFLRRLGPSISDLKILYKGWSSNQCDHIHEYINNYCSESLNKIEFCDKKQWISIQHFKKPFVNVRAVEVLYGDLRNQFPSFAEWFPNMRSLRLCRVRTLRFIEPSFLNLEDLSIDIDGVPGFTNTKATCLLKQLPQLHSLNIDVNGKTTALSTLLNITKNNPNIHYLNVGMRNFIGHPSVGPVTASDIQQLVKNHSMLVELKLDYALTVDIVLSVTHQLNSLKVFHFKVANRSVYDLIESRLNGQWRSTLNVVDHFSEDLIMKLEQ